MKSYHSGLINFPSLLVLHEISQVLPNVILKYRCMALQHYTALDLLDIDEYRSLWISSKVANLLRVFPGWM